MCVSFQIQQGGNIDFGDGQLKWFSFARIINDLLAEKVVCDSPWKVSGLKYEVFMGNIIEVSEKYAISKDTECWTVHQKTLIKKKFMKYSFGGNSIVIWR